MNNEIRIKLENKMELLGLRKSDKLMCACCGKEPNNIEEIVYESEMEGVTPEEFTKTDGTYSSIANLFVCTDCYRKAGMPSISMRDIKSEFDYEIGKLNIIKISKEKLE